MISALPSSLDVGARWRLFLVAAAWLAFGLFPHDPWKSQEAISFGVTYHILESGDWLVPGLAGEDYLEHMPLLPYTGAILALGLSPVMAVHDAARLAAALFVGLALLSVGYAARRLYGAGTGWMGVLALLGCVGLMIRAHQMIPDLVSMSALALGMLGLALAARSPLAGGVLLGTGIGIGFLGEGVLPPLVLIATALLLPLANRDWRRREHALAVAIAALAAAPWLLAWPLALHHYEPKLFQVWLSYHLPSQIQPFRDDALFSAGYYLVNLPWYAWPAAPLAFWTFWRGGLKVLREPGVALPLLVLALTLAATSITEEAEEVRTLLLLPPLALLAVRHLDDLPRGAASALDWFGVMTFGLLAGALWLCWVALASGHPEFVAALLERQLPGGRASTPGLAAIIVGLVFSLLWLALVRPREPTSRRALLNWAGGLTLTWVLLSTVWLNWLDSAKTYRGLVAEIQRALPKQRTCVASAGLRDAQRSLLYYLGHIVTRRTEDTRRNECDVLLIQTRAGDPPHPSQRWRLLWQGSRTGDSKERFYLYRLVRSRR